jgi:hypothetical protein
VERRRMVEGTTVESRLEEDDKTMDKANG